VLEHAVLNVNLVGLIAGEGGDELGQHAVGLPGLELVMK
jgi:hypothetical protein